MSHSWPYVWPGVVSPCFGKAKGVDIREGGCVIVAPNCNEFQTIVAVASGWRYVWTCYMVDLCGSLILHREVDVHN